jgi:hypothetical protein
MSPFYILIDLLQPGGYINNGILQKLGARLLASGSPSEVH